MNAHMLLLLLLLLLLFIGSSLSRSGVSLCRLVMKGEGRSILIDMLHTAEQWSRAPLSPALLLLLV